MPNLVKGGGTAICLLAAACGSHFQTHAGGRKGRRVLAFVSF